MTTDNNHHDNEKRLDESRQYWNDVAASFDTEPDHGLHNPVVLEAWTQLLRTCATAIDQCDDIGCGLWNRITQSCAGRDLDTK